jgi:succinyl-diaminopimelate desuccinylase
MTETEKLIIEAVENRKEDFVEFFQSLIQIPSFTGQEKEVADALVEGMKARGFQDIEIVERIPGHPNVLAHIKGNEEGPTFTFNGHLDILPPQNNNQWKYPPFSGHIEDGKIYGRGTVDMKAGTFSSFFAGLIIKGLGYTFERKCAVYRCLRRRDLWRKWHVVLNQKWLCKKET